MTESAASSCSQASTDLVRYLPNDGLLQLSEEFSPSISIALQSIGEDTTNLEQVVSLNKEKLQGFSPMEKKAILSNFSVTVLNQGEYVTQFAYVVEQLIDSLSEEDWKSFGWQSAQIGKRQLQYNLLKELADKKILSQKRKLDSIKKIDSFWKGNQHWIAILQKEKLIIGEDLSEGLLGQLVRIAEQSSYQQKTIEDIILEFRNQIKQRVVRPRTSKEEILRPQDAQRAFDVLFPVLVRCSISIWEFFFF